MPWARHPILCLCRTNGQPLRRYLGEILIQEGYVCFDGEHLDSVPDLEAALSGRALVFLSASSLQPAEVAVIVDHVRRGGRMILVKPSVNLLEALSVNIVERPHRVYGEAPPAYARIEEHPWTGAHGGLAVQVHAPTTLCRLEGVRVIAYTALRRDEASPFPAAFELNVGQGRAAVFLFEVGQSIVLTRQGDPRRASNSGWPREDAGVVKPGTMLYGHLDPELRDVPQADVWADLLVGTIRGLTDDALPIPRLWHFPDDSPALTLLDGDSDAYNWDAYEKLVEPCVAQGVPYTLNMMPKHLAELDRKTADGWVARGNDFQLHYRLPTGKPAVEDARQCLPEQQELFRKTLGRESVTTRGHSVLWPGYTEMAAILANCGVRMETNYMPFRGCQYGYCGSARPGRYITLNGQTLEVSQQPTTFMDDPMSNEKSGLPARSPDDAYEIMTRFYDQAVRQYHGVVCTCLHPVSYGEPRNLRFADLQPAMRQAVLDATRRLGLKAMTLPAWSDFHEARRGIDMWLESDHWFARTDRDIDGLTVHCPGTDGTVCQGHAWRTFRWSAKAGESLDLGPR